MANLFASGRIVDGIVILMLLELIILAAVRRKTRRGLTTSKLFISLLAGAALLLSLRAALTGYAWQIVAAWLAVALVAHVVDLKLRWAA